LIKILILYIILGWDAVKTLKLKMIIWLCYLVNIHCKPITMTQLLKYYITSTKLKNKKLINIWLYMWFRHFDIGFYFVFKCYYFNFLFIMKFLGLCKNNNYYIINCQWTLQHQNTCIGYLESANNVWCFYKTTNLWEKLWQAKICNLGI
jgi:hypothetical protein